ncbi:MAG: AI-2E family transporter [Peptoniphilaceae bacterium]|uniref:AI-2E family transporter n=1 Tax=Parvimonas sp. TaxID=1944660 RepID=UPI0025D4880E|nr:AI-2E family transporter [Parvimonas sp.]MCI5997638.1 AI-2E family transporter [Parvimonas sp.]MDD7765330.1 AI-2E family transporter [Peptoniphilaceae bacterium]MDY3051249.1 AI-2E family transporter [Parvimonas sp.]
MLDNLFGINMILNNVIKILIIGLLSWGLYVFFKFSNKKLEEKDKIHINKLKLLRIAIYVLICIGAIALFKSFSILRITLATFVVSIIFSYILNPLVNYFEKKNIKRIYSIFLVYLIIFLSLAILIIGIFPGTIKQFKNLFISLPDLVKNFVEYTNDLRDKLFTNVPVVNNLINNFNEQIMKLVSLLTQGILSRISGMVAGVSGLIAVFIQLILIPVISFYLLLEKDKIFNKIGKTVPDRYKKFSIDLWKEVDNSLSMFVRGRIVMAIFVGVATMIYLAIMGIDFALVIGIITCIADIIPYIGPFLGFVPAVLLALFKGPITAFWVAVCFCLIQWVENNILGPKILGDSTGMHPLTVLILLIVGGGMFGVAGMILSVPIVAALKIVYKHTKPYIIKYLYNDKLKND